MAMSKSKDNLFSCRPRFRVLIDKRIALGPGKVDLLEAIEEAGSISQAARQMKLSYRRAWEMVDTMNRCFKHPLVARVTGGKGGGGARLTESGARMVRLYRSMESAANEAVKEQWQSIRRDLKPRKPAK